MSHKDPTLSNRNGAIWEGSRGVPQHQRYPRICLGMSLVANFKWKSMLIVNFQGTNEIYIAGINDALKNPT